MPEPYQPDAYTAELQKPFYTFFYIVFSLGLGITMALGHGPSGIGFVIFGYALTLFGVYLVGTEVIFRVRMWRRKRSHPAELGDAAQLTGEPSTTKSE